MTRNPSQKNKIALLFNRMKKAAFIITAILLNMASSAREASMYHIHIKWTGAHDSVVYMAHYYGKSWPDFFVMDSARLDMNGAAEFTGKDTSFAGGVCIMLLDRRTHFDFLLGKNDDFDITVSTDRFPEAAKLDKVTFTHSPENEHFQEYFNLLKDYGGTKTLPEKILAYRREYEKKYPGTFLTEIFYTMEKPEIPAGPYYLPDGKTIDSGFASRYEKAHYWDGFNFNDNRLVFTPQYDGRLKDYMARLVAHAPDSFIHESKILLTKTKDAKDLFNYTLWSLVSYAEKSRAQGMENALLYLLDNYYLKGYATWLTDKELKKYEEIAKDIKYPSGITGNHVGNNAPEILLPNIKTEKEESMTSMKAKYTLLVFFSPSCGHCQHEIPLLDSLYRAVLKDKGVKVYTVSTEGSVNEVRDFVATHKIDDWTNTWDRGHVGDYHNKYEVYITPEIYLLDENKIVKGKHLDHTNIADLIDQSDNGVKAKPKE